MANHTELDFIVNVLFEDKKIEKKIFKKINYSKLTEIASSHMILPSLYFNIEQKNYLSKIPIDFKTYLNEIFTLNKERNIRLMGEVQELTNFLNNNKINHIYIKGCASIFSNVYSDIGERMITDIDFFYYNTKSNVLSEVLELNEYYVVSEFSFFKKHLNRRVNKKKEFSIEPHFKILDYNEKLINLKKLIKTKMQTNGVNVPNYDYQLLNSIYNHQINDRGFIKLHVNLRSMYESSQIYKKKRKLSFNNKYINRYFLLSNHYKINIINSSVKDNNSKFRLKLRKNILFKKLDTFIVKLILLSNLRLVQIIEFINNSSYRKYIIKNKF